MLARILARGLTKIGMLEKKSHNLMGIFFCSLGAFVWGFAFIAQRQAADDVPLFTFNGFRFSLAVVVLAIFLLICTLWDRKKGVKRIGWNKPTFIFGALCGVSIFIANNLQQYGIAHTTVGKAGFITALYIVIVPIFSVLLRRRISLSSGIAVAIAVLGFYIMCIDAESGLTQADGMLLLCSVGFSLQIMFIDMCVGETDPLKLTLVQFLVASLLSLPAMAIEGFPPIEVVGENVIPILYVGIMSAGVGFTLQTLGQKYSPPELVTLIMSLESVIAFVGGVAVFHESYSAKEFAGCILVMCAVFLAQLSFPRRMLKANHSKFFIE